jgi:hypothetical protein
LCFLLRQPRRRPPPQLSGAAMEALHEEMPFDLDFHPSSPLVVTSIITGELCLYALRTAQTETPSFPSQFACSNAFPIWLVSQVPLRPGVAA